MVCINVKQTGVCRAMMKLFFILGLVFFETASFAISELRVSLVGDSAVGKTALIEALRGNKFPEVSVMSVGLDYAFYKGVVDLEDIDFMIVDTPGASYFRNSISPLIRNYLDGVLIVFDVFDYDSFKNVEVWIKHVRSLANGTPIVIVGNKTEYIENRAVDKDTAQQFANKHGLEYFEASAKKGPGLEEPLKHLARFSSTKKNSKIRGLYLPISSDEDIYFDGIDKNFIDLLKMLLDMDKKPESHDFSFSNYFFQDQLSHQHLINMAERLDRHIAFCLKNIREIKKLEHKISKITHYRIFSFMVSLAINFNADQ